jgi:hypothetical protein
MSQRDHIRIIVHLGGQTESWLVVYKDGRVKYHEENDGYAFMRNGPEAHEKWLTMDEVRALGTCGMYPPSEDSARPFIVRVEEAIRMLNKETPDEPTRDQ